MERVDAGSARPFEPLPRRRSAGISAADLQDYALVAREVPERPFDVATDPQTDQTNRGLVPPESKTMLKKKPVKNSEKISVTFALEPLEQATAVWSRLSGAPASRLIVAWNGLMAERR